MQESKYVEDVVSLIKQNLKHRGFQNEHDRLGHFESVVPLDTIFALASPNNRIKIFALQFKAPRFSNTRVSWRLTHPLKQFLSLVENWHHFIWYCLPTYESPEQSDCALKHIRLVNAEGMASEERKILSSQKPVPEYHRTYLVPERKPIKSNITETYSHIANRRLSI